MLLILVKVSVKVAVGLRQPQSYHHATYSSGSRNTLDMHPKGYLHATDQSLDMQPKVYYLHATSVSIRIRKVCHIHVYIITSHDTYRN